MNDDWYFDCLLTYFSLFWSISLFYVYVCVCKFWYIKNINAWCVLAFTITYDMQNDTMWWRGDIKKIFDTSYILWVDICTNNQNLQKLPKHPWLSQDFSFLLPFMMTQPSLWGYLFNILCSHPCMLPVGQNVCLK